MHPTTGQITHFQLFLIFLYAFSGFLQITGIYVLCYTKRLKANQRLILMHVSINHIGFAVVFIYKLLKVIINDEEQHDDVFIAYFRGILGATYPLLMHYLSIDRMLEIYLHLKYPIYFTKRVSYFIIIMLWFISSVFGIINSILCYYRHKLYEKIPKYIYPLMSWSVLFTVLFVYIYLYQKWRGLQKHAPKMTKCSPAKSKRFLIPFLVVFSFILFEIFGSTISIIQNTTELHENTDDLIRCVALTLFALGEISDVFIYIFLQRNIRKILFKNIIGRRNTSVSNKDQKSELSQASSYCRSRLASFIHASKDTNQNASTPNTKNSNKTTAYRTISKASSANACNSLCVIQNINTNNHLTRL